VVVGGEEDAEGVVVGWLDACGVGCGGGGVGTVDAVGSSRWLSVVVVVNLIGRLCWHVGLVVAALFCYGASTSASSGRHLGGWDEGEMSEVLARTEAEEEGKLKDSNDMTGP
jgi:hypothetical protein